MGRVLHLLFLVALAGSGVLAISEARAERYYWLDGPAPAGLDPAIATARPLDEGTVLVTAEEGALGAPAVEWTVPAGTVVHVVRLHDARDRSALDTHGVTVLLRTRQFAVVALDPEVLPSYGGCLGERLVRSRRSTATASLRPAAGKVDPTVKANLVAAVDQARFMEIVEELSGARSFELGGNTITNNDRYTFRSGHYVAADYLEDRFEALGYTVVRQDFSVSSTPTQNVVAIKTGITTPEEIVVVGGHYDTTSFRDNINGPAPGAEDNGSGTAGVLHLAEILAGYDTDRTIHFVAFGAEEQGLYGSEYYVDQAVLNGDAIVAAFNMDMVSAYTTNYRIDIEGRSNWPALNDLMNLYDANVTEFAPGLGTVQKFFSFGSDHVPFQNAGIPCFLVIESDYDSYPGYHYTTDTAEKLTPSLGRDVLRAMAATVADLTDPKTTTDVAVVATGLTASWVEGGVELRWQVRDASSVAGFVVWRSFGRGPLMPLFAQPLPPREGTMRWVDREVSPDPMRTYQLEAISHAGERWLLPEGAQPAAPPRVFWLAQNVPNPFNPRTDIAFSIASPTHAQMDIHDAAGRRVRRLVDADLPAGPHQVVWDGTDDDGRAVASGVFYYRLRADGSLRTRRMLLVR